RPVWPRPCWWTSATSARRHPISAPTIRGWKWKTPMCSVAAWTTNIIGAMLPAFSPCARRTDMLAFIGGTGLTRLPNLEIIERKQVRSRYGEVRVVKGELAGKQVLFLARHGDPHVLLPHQVNYRANVMALKEAGATSV